MLRTTLFIVLFISLNTLSAQTVDSLSVVAGVRFQAADGFQPFWAKANKFGLSSNYSTDQLTWGEISNSKVLKKIRFLSDSATAIALSYGATVFNAESYSRTVIQQAYAQLKHNKILIRAGRHRDLWDDLDPDLSSGSLGTSGNALPIPKITIAIDDYVNIPFTKGKLQFKGMIGHGWLGSNRFMESFLHEKSFYGRINFGKLKVYGGIQHYTEWGGERPSENIYLDRSLKGFLNVLFVTESNDGSLPLEREEGGFRPNRAGDQRGLAELGLYYENDRIWIHGYHQTPFESGTGIDIRNVDKLLGLHVKFKGKRVLLTDLVIEFISTKQMESFGKEMQSYYNNGAMKTGWEYENNVIGSPLLTNRKEASNYLPIVPFNWRGTDAIPGNNNIVNSRVMGGNIATRWRLGEKIGLRNKLTPIVNYGARNFENFYRNGAGAFECYTLFEGYYQTRSLKFSAGFTGDFGKLYSKFGSVFGMQYYIL